MESSHYPPVSSQPYAPPIQRRAASPSLPDQRHFPPQSQHYAPVASYHQPPQSYYGQPLAPTERTPPPPSSRPYPVHGQPGPYQYGGPEDGLAKLYAAAVHARDIQAESHYAEQRPRDGFVAPQHPYAQGAPDRSLPYYGAPYYPAQPPSWIDPRQHITTPSYPPPHNYARRLPPDYNPPNVGPAVYEPPAHRDDPGDRYAHPHTTAPPVSRPGHTDFPGPAASPRSTPNSSIPPDRRHSSFTISDLVNPSAPSDEYSRARQHSQSVLGEASQMPLRRSPSPAVAQRPEDLRPPLAYPPPPSSLPPTSSYSTMPSHSHPSQYATSHSPASASYHHYPTHMPAYQLPAPHQPHSPYQYDPRSLYANQGPPHPHAYPPTSEQAGRAHPPMQMQAHRDFSPIHRHPASPPHSRVESESSDLRTSFERRNSIDVKTASQDDSESLVAAIPDVEDKPVKAGLKRRKGDSSKQPRKSVKLTDNSSETVGEGASETAVAKKRKPKAGINGKEKGAGGADEVVVDGTTTKGRKKKAAVTEVANKQGKSRVTGKIESLENVVVGTEIMNALRDGEREVGSEESNGHVLEDKQKVVSPGARLGFDEMKDQVFVDARVGIEMHRDVRTPESASGSADGIGSPEADSNDVKQITDECPLTPPVTSTRREATPDGEEVLSAESNSNSPPYVNDDDSSRSYLPGIPISSAHRPPAHREKNYHHSNSRRNSDNNQEKYCPCGKRKPDDFYIACDACEGERWFHNGCVGLSAEDAEKFEKWVCDSCLSRGIQPVMKKRCARVGCDEFLKGEESGRKAGKGKEKEGDGGSGERSKYCSANCGIRAAEGRVKELISEGKVGRKEDVSKVVERRMKGEEAQRVDESDLKALGVLRGRKKRRKGVLTMLEERQKRVDGVIRRVLAINEGKGEKERVCGFDTRIVYEWGVDVDQWPPDDMGEETRRDGVEGAVQTGATVSEAVSNGESIAPTAEPEVMDVDPVGGNVPTSLGEATQPASAETQIAADGGSVLASFTDPADTSDPAGATHLQVNGVSDDLAHQQLATEAETDKLLPTMCGNVRKCPLHEGWEFIKSREVQVDIDEQLHLLRRDRNEANGIKLRLRRRRAVAKAGLIGSV